MSQFPTVREMTPLLLIHCLSRPVAVLWCLEAFAWRRSGCRSQDARAMDSTLQGARNVQNGVPSLKFASDDLSYRCLLRWQWQYWNYMKLYEIIWNYMKLYEIIWNYMKLYEIIWNYMDLWSSKFHSFLWCQDVVCCSWPHPCDCTTPAMCRWRSNSPQATRCAVFQREFGRLLPIPKSWLMLLWQCILDKTYSYSDAVLLNAWAIDHRQPTCSLPRSSDRF